MRKRTGPVIPYFSYQQLADIKTDKNKLLNICFQVWECVAPHLATLEEMEALDPDALRLETKTPTGIVMADRLDILLVFCESTYHPITSTKMIPGRNISEILFSPVVVLPY